MELEDELPFEPGLYFAFDAVRNMVFLMLGFLCLAQMSLNDYRDAFGLEATRRLLAER